MNREPVLILIGAAVLLALGVDLAGFAETVERIVQAVTLAGGVALARGRVTPTADPRLTEDGTETPPAS